MSGIKIPMRYKPEHLEFEFYYLPKNEIKHEDVSKYCSWVSKNYALICKEGMTSELNSEWILRTYNATKMVMASTLLLNSAEYCIENNVLSAVPYLLYYSAFNACRSLIYLAPLSVTKSLDGLIEISHSKVVNIIPDIIARLNEPLSIMIKKQLYELRHERELFSYNFPSRGLTKEPDFRGTVNLCGVLVELAELTGRRLQHYIEKHFLSDEKSRIDAAKTWQVLDSDIISKLFTYKKKTEKNKEEILWIDREDWYRVDYIKRKVKYPCSILFTMTEGMTEDFFGAWYREFCIEEGFNPDKGWNIIFPIP
ncbi:hypothetical protein GKZ28_01640 [Clostridium chromiireducens]|uniref:Uncharacterized protein n=1 Tax=Clostridium chromiireducens TaxID=225345 RepID=A0A964RIV5_9CLOT|nr:hypothetical protein [Clostridium chromiireducens]MVX62403.1 hypothetical protein [Clostridium chromiireducens]